METFYVSKRNMYHMAFRIPFQNIACEVSAWEAHRIDFFPVQSFLCNHFYLHCPQFLNYPNIFYFIIIQSRSIVISFFNCFLSMKFTPCCNGQCHDVISFELKLHEQNFCLIFLIGGQLNCKWPQNRNFLNYLNIDWTSWMSVFSDNNNKLNIL